MLVFKSILKARAIVRSRQIEGMSGSPLTIDLCAELVLSIESMVQAQARVNAFTYQVRPGFARDETLYGRASVTS
jgi:hypothetical protein